MLQISRDLQQHLPKVGVATYDMGSKDGVAFRFDPINGFPGERDCAHITFSQNKVKMVSNAFFFLKI